MELWDGTFPMYAKGETEVKPFNGATIGSKIVITNPDFVARDLYGMKVGDVGKVVGAYKDTYILAVNPRWNAPDRSEDPNLKYNGYACLLTVDEFKTCLEDC